MELSEGASEPGTNAPAVPAVPAGEESAVLQRGGAASKEERWVLCSEKWLTSALGKPRDSRRSQRWRQRKCFQAQTCTSSCWRPKARRDAYNKAKESK